jgi:RNA polymerase sigma-70 factor (ECF subfamily)
MNAVDMIQTSPRYFPGSHLLARLRGCQDAVYSVCFQVLRHPQDAEDAAQNVFLAILDGVPAIPDEIQFRRWVRRVSFNVALKYRRQARTRREYERRKAKDVPSTAPGLADETSEEILDHIARLDDDSRDLVIAHYYAGRSLAELAQDRGCSPVAIWKRLAKARRTLRDSMERAGFGAVTPLVDRFLEQRMPQRAPENLLTEGIVAKAVRLTASSGLAVPLAAIGGIVVKTKILVGVTLALLAAVAWVGHSVIPSSGKAVPDAARVAGSRSAGRPASAQGVDPQRVPATTSVPSRTIAGTEEAPAPIARSHEPVTAFATLEAFMIALREAVRKPEGESRWQALRRLGFSRSDEEFQKAFAGFAQEMKLFNPETIVNETFTHLEVSAWNRIIVSWSTEDPKACATFLGTLPEYERANSFRNAAIRAAVPAWARLEPEAAAAFAEEHLPPGPLKTQALNEIAIVSDPARFASQLLPGITERNERSSAVISLIQEWLPVDARAVSRWALELPLEEDRAIAAPTLAAFWVRRDPAATMAWAKGIEEPAVRDAVAENITIGLASMDKKEAAQWVNQSALQESRKAMLLDYIQRARLFRDVR